MKKYVVMLVIMCMAVGILTSCGKKEEESKAKESKTETAQEETVLDMPSMEKMDYSKAVELGEYKGLKLTRAVSPVTDEVLETKISNLLAQYPTAVAQGESAGEGDVVNIDYEGKLDGEAFEGGTGTGYELTLGSGSFIGEEGLIGALKGQTLDLNVTFPEDYENNPDLAGGAAVFTVTVNEIKRAAEGLSDEWVAANTQYKTVDEYRSELKKTLEEDSKLTAQETIKSEAYNKVIESAKVKDYPEGIREFGEQRYKTSVEQQAQQSGMNMDAFLKAQGMTQEQFDGDVKVNGESAAKEALVINAIADKEGLKKSDKAYEKALDELVTRSGFASEDEFMKSYGENNVHISVMAEVVADLIVKEAKVS